MKLVAGTTALVLLLGTTLALLAHSYLVAGLEQQLEMRAILLANQTARLAAVPVLTEQQIDLDLILAEMFEQRDVVYIFVEDADRQVIGHTFAKGDEAGGFPSDLLGVNPLQPGSGSSVLRLADGTDYIVDATVPIMDGDVGFVHLGMSGRSVVDSARHLSSVLVLVTVLTVFIGGILMAGFAILTTRPISELTGAALAVAKGSLRRKVAVQSRDEVGQLGVAWNAMVEELHRTDATHTATAAILKLSLDGASLDDILRRTLDYVVLLPWARFSGNARVSLIEEGVLVSTMVRGDPRQPEQCSRVPLGKCVCGSTAADGKFRFVSSSRDPEAVAGVDHWQYCVPIAYGEDILGVLQVDVPPDSAYDPREEDFLGGVADTLAGIVARRRSETENVALQQQLAHAMKVEAIGRLAGGVAHDFNNLLTSIVIFTRFVKDDLATDHPRQDDLAEVLRAADSAARLTNELLAFSRQRVIEPEVIELNECTLGLVKMLRRVVGETIDVSVTVSEPVYVLLDSAQLDQVLVNLAVNARDAMPSGGVLHVEVRSAYKDSSSGLPAGEYAEVAVTDTGVGIAPDIFEQVLEPFFTTKGERGTGLGLATCRNVAQRAKGDVTIESEVGHGTTVTFILPRVDAPQRSDELPADVANPSRRGVVLIVEDQPSVLRAMEQTLRNAGYETLQARTAEDGLDLALRLTVPPDLLVTDVVLPGLSGIELAKELRTRLAGLSVVFVSGYMSEEQTADIVTGARTAFVQKPFEPAQLVEAAHRVLSSMLGAEIAPNEWTH